MSRKTPSARRAERDTDRHLARSLRRDERDDAEHAARGKHQPGDAERRHQKDAELRPGQGARYGVRHRLEADRHPGSIAVSAERI